VLGTHCVGIGTDLKVGRYRRKLEIQGRPLECFWWGTMVMKGTAEFANVGHNLLL